jgi:hypothetical protein
MGSECASFCKPQEVVVSNFTSHENNTKKYTKFYSSACCNFTSCHDHKLCIAGDEKLLVKGPTLASISMKFVPNFMKFSSKRRRPRAVVVFPRQGERNPADDSKLVFHMKFPQTRRYSHQRKQCPTQTSPFLWV